MKTIATIILVVFSTLNSFSQETLKLSIIKGTEKPNSETEHFYLLKVSNTTNSEFTFNISATNKSCNNEQLLQTDLKQEILDKQKSKILDVINIQTGKTVEFYVKISRTQNATQNSWNCTEIKAISNNGNVLSNIITIESLIPNPNNAD